MAAHRHHHQTMCHRATNRPANVAAYIYNVLAVHIDQSVCCVFLIYIYKIFVLCNLFFLFLWLLSILIIKYKSI